MEDFRTDDFQIVDMEMLSIHCKQIDKDAKAMDNLKIGEEFKDRNGTTWTRNEEGQLEQKGRFLGKYTMPFFCPECGKIMKGIFRIRINF